MALVNSGCSCSVVSKSVFQLWRREDVDLLAVDRKTRKYCSVEDVNPDIYNVDSVKIEFLVIDRKPLGFNFLLGINAIKTLC